MGGRIHKQQRLSNRVAFLFCTETEYGMKKIIGYALVLTVITFFPAGVITLFAHFGLDEYMQGVVSAAIGYMAIKMTDEYFKDKNNGK